MKTIGKLALVLIGSLILVCAVSAQSNIGGAGGSTVVQAGPLNAIYASPNCASGQTRCVQLPASGGILWDCTWSNSSSTITCPDAVFTSANVTGFTAFCVNNPDLPGGGLEVTGSVVQCGASGSRATLSYVSSTQVSITPRTTTGACTYSAPSQGCELIWYNLADTQLATAWTAAASSPDCVSLQVAAGVYGISTANFNTGTNACKLGVGIARTGPGLFGQGMDSTVLVLDPAFNFSSCTAGTSGTACLLSSGGIQLQNFQIFGGCNPINSAHSNNMVELDSGIANTTTLVNNVSFSCFGGNSSGLVGVQVYNNTPQPVTGLWIQDFGTTNLQITPNGGSSGFSAAGLYVEDCAAACVSLNGSGTFLSTTGSVFGPTIGSFNTVNVSGGGWADWDGSVDYNSAQVSTTSNGVGITGSGSVNLHGTAIQLPVGSTLNQISFAGAGSAKLTGVFVSGPNGILWPSSGAATVTATNSTFSNASGYLLNFNSNASSKFIDACGNTFAGSFPAGNPSGNNVFGSCSITGTTVTAAKTVLSAGWGSTAAVTALSGATSPIQFTITNSGTGQATGATITYTYPTPYLIAPQWCSAVQAGGNQTGLTYAVGTPTATSVVITETGAPTVNDTEIMQVQCYAQN